MKKKKSEEVLLIQDPFQSSLQDVHEAQATDEPLDLDGLEAKMEIHHEEALEQNRSEAVEAESADAKEATPQTDDESDASPLPPAPFAGLSGQELDPAVVQSSIESVLFVSDRPLSLQRLKDILGDTVETAVYEAAIQALQARYQDSAHGIELCEIASGYQFRTKPTSARAVQRLAKVQTQRLTKGAMETLAIVAYKQPTMREDIDKIRGVDSSHFLRTLLERGLVEMAGRSELPGRPILYRTTKFFLELFGLGNLDGLPPLQEIEAMVPHVQADETDPTLLEIRKLVTKMNLDGAILKNPLEADSEVETEDQRLLREIRERISAIPIATPYLDELQAEPSTNENTEPQTLL